MADLAELNLKVDSRQVVSADKALRDLAQTAKRTEQNTNELTSSNQRLESSLAKAERAYDKLAGTLLRIIGLSATTAGLFKAIDNAVAFERTELAFQTLIGNVEEAQTLLKGLIDFSRNTPFSYQSIADAARFMLAMGFEANKVDASIRTLVTTTAALGGTTQVLDRLILAFGQMRAKGAVSAEEMRQLAEAGIPAWEILSKKIGVSIPEAMDLVKRRAVDSNAAVSVFMDELNKRYGALFDVYATKLPGALGQLSNQIQLFSKDVGKSVADSFNFVGGAQALTAFFGFLQNALPQALHLITDWSARAEEASVGTDMLTLALQALLGVMTAVAVAGLGRLLTSATSSIGALLALRAGVKTTADSFAFLQLALGTNWFGILAIGVGGLVAALPSLVRWLSDTSEQTQRLKVSFEASSNAADQLAASVIRLRAAQKNNDPGSQASVLDSNIENIKKMQEGLLALEDLRKKIDAQGISSSRIGEPWRAGHRAGDTNWGGSFEKEFAALEALALQANSPEVMQAFNRLKMNTAIGVDGVGSTRTIKDTSLAYQQLKDIMDALTGASGKLKESFNQDDPFANLRNNIASLITIYKELAQTMDDRYTARADPRTGAANAAEKSFLDKLESSKIGGKNDPDTEYAVMFIRDLAEGYYDAEQTLESYLKMSDDVTDSIKKQEKANDDAYEAIIATVQAKQLELKIAKELDPIRKAELEVRQELLAKTGGVEIEGFQAVLQALVKIRLELDKIKDATKDVDGIRNMIRAAEEQIADADGGDRARDLARQLRQARATGARQGLTPSQIAAQTAELEATINGLYTSRQQQVEREWAQRNQEDRGLLKYKSGSAAYAGKQAVLEMQRDARSRGTPISDNDERLKKRRETAEAYQREVDYYARVSAMADGIGETIADGFGDMLTGAKSVTEALGDMYKMLVQLILKYTVLVPLAQAISGGVFGAVTGGALPGMGPGSKMGNAFMGGQLIPFAKGGVVGGPTLFPMAGNRMGLMGEAGPEGILPLTRTSSGRLGVESTGGRGGGVYNTYMNVYTKDAGSFNRSQTQLARKASTAMRR